MGDVSLANLHCVHDSRVLFWRFAVCSSVLIKCRNKRAWVVQASQRAVEGSEIPAVRVQCVKGCFNSYFAFKFPNSRTGYFLVESLTPFNYSFGNCSDILESFADLHNRTAE